MDACSAARCATSQIITTVQYSQEVHKVNDLLCDVYVCQFTHMIQAYFPSSGAIR